MKIFGKTLTIKLSSAATLVAAAEAGLASAVQRAAQAGNPIGDAAIAAAKAAEAPGATGAEKKAAVISVVAPIVVTEAAKGGMSALVVDAETFAGLVVEEVVAGMKATPLGMIASALLAAFGIKLS